MATWAARAAGCLTQAGDWAQDRSFNRLGSFGWLLAGAGISSERVPPDSGEEEMVTRRAAWAGVRTGPVLPTLAADEGLVSEPVGAPAAVGGRRRGSRARCRVAPRPLDPRDGLTRQRRRPVAAAERGGLLGLYT